MSTLDTLQNLVRELVILIILAVTLELLLPHGDMRRYVRMVLGLLIIVAVLQAGMSFWHRELAADLSWLSLGPPDQAATAEILREGERLWQAGQSRAQAEYEQGLARQIRGLAGLNPDVAVTAVRVRTTAGTPDGQPGRLEEVILVLEGEPLVGEDRPVWAAPAERSDPEAVERLRRIVADFYSLSPAQVTVEYQE